MTAAASEAVVDFQACWAEMDLPAHVHEVLAAAPLVQTPENRPQLLDWALGRASGATDWRHGNRDDHGVYEAVFQAGAAGARGRGRGDQGAQRAGHQFP